jgi:ABC-type sugar transport system ATPase subunit
VDQHTTTASPGEDAGPRRAPAALQVDGVSKRFAAVHALTDVGVTFEGGRVTAVLGENGAGKSTLIRLCSGEHLPDTGQVLIGGEPAVLRSPIEATRRGIAVVHQEPQLVAEMTIAENIFLTRLGDRRGASAHRTRALTAEARELLARIGLQDELPNVGRLCRNLSAAERQLVEIARALAGAPRVLFLDEPNSSLTRRETDRLFSIVRRLRDEGVAVVLVSHRLGEVYEVSDHIVVLRDGRKVGEGSPEDQPTAKAIELMAGERLQAAAALEDAPDRSVDVGAVPVLSLRGVTGGRFADVDLDIHAGEIVGMSGLVGAGRTEIAQAVVGADPVLGGTLLLNGRPVRFSSPRQALRAGVAFISEERRTSVFYGQAVRFNLTSTVLERFGRAGFFSRRRQGAFARSAADSFGVKAAGIEAPIRSLSGGNQQKVLLARALAANPKLIILDEPTRGVDVGTKAEIYRLLRRLAHEDGLAVWFISSELDEVLQLADRIVVIREGRLVDDLPRGPQAARVVASALGERLADAATTQLVSGPSMTDAASLDQHTDLAAEPAEQAETRKDPS